MARSDIELRSLSALVLAITAALVPLVGPSAAAAAAAAQPAAQQPSAGQPSAAQPSADDAYLDALLGSWVVDGTYAGKPARYRGRGERVLQGGFLRLHLVDTAKPPQYEASVFLAYDPKQKDFVVHWLDNFGAVGARVVALGRRDGERLVVTFPYAEGAVRDTFTRDPAAGGWTLLLEEQGSSGAWSTSGSFTFARPAGTKRPR